MNLNVNIDIDSVLGSIEIKDLEQYIRRRKLDEIQNPGSVTNSNPTTIKLGLTKKINLNNHYMEDDDAFDSDLFGDSDDDYNL